MGFLLSPHPDRGNMESNLQGTFLLNNTPLTQFSEMKAPVCQYSVQNSFYKLSPPGLGPQLAAGTPHGITDILSRPVATPNSSLLSSYPHVAGFGGLGSQGVYYGPQVGNFSKAGNEYPTRTRNCWADTGQDWRGGRQCSNSEYGAALDREEEPWEGDTHGGGLAPPAHLSSAAIRQPSSNTWIRLSTQCWTRLSSPHPIPALFGWASGSPPRPPTSCHLSCPPKEPGSAEDHRAHTSLASGPAGSSRYFSHPETMSPLLHPKQADSVSSEKLPQHHLPREPTRTLAPFRDTEYMLSPLRSHLPPGRLFSHRPPQGLGQQ